MGSDADFAARIKGSGIEVPTRPGTSPASWTWHHILDRPGVMQLVPRAQHQAGAYQSLGNVQSSVESRCDEDEDGGCFLPRWFTFARIVGASTCRRTGTRNVVRKGRAAWTASARLPSCPKDRATSRSSRTRCSPPARTA